MTDRIRVLSALAQRRGTEFTVQDLAEATGVNISTVRTVLHRERRFLLACGRLEAGGRGGRSIRYRLNENERPALEAELAAENPKWQSQNDDTYIEPPLSLLAAEDIITRQLSECPPERSEMLMAEAALELEATRVLCDGRQAGSAGFHVLTTRVLVLEQAIRAVHVVRAPHPDWSVAWQVVEQLFAPIRKAFDSLVAAFRSRVPLSVPAMAAVAATAGADVTLVYRDARSYALRKHRLDNAARLPQPALLDAAAYFRERVAGPSKGEVEREAAKYADKIASMLDPDLPVHALTVLGQGPAIFQTNVAVIPQEPDADKITINTREYTRACMDMPAVQTPVEPLLVRAAGAGLH